MQGKADYVRKAGGRVAWVIAAKSAEADITPDAIEQAYTYAHHREIDAVYFCLSADSEFRVYATDAIPERAFLFSVDPRDTQQAAKALQPTLGPAVFLGRFAQQVADTQPAIGPGLPVLCTNCPWFRRPTAHDNTAVFPKGRTQL